jgi:hypothetical protein
MAIEPSASYRFAIPRDAPPESLTYRLLSENIKEAPTKRPYPSQSATLAWGGVGLMATEQLAPGTLVELFEGPEDVKYDGLCDYDKRYVLIYHHAASDTWRYLLPLSPARFSWRVYDAQTYSRHADMPTTDARPTVS